MKLFSALILILFVSCVVEDSQYLDEIETYRIDRVKNLTAPISWTSLSGLNWLIEGENNLGSSRESNIRFPKDAPSVLGTIMNSDDSLSFVANPATPIYNDGERISDTRLYSDLEEENKKLNHGQYFFTIIDRNEKLGVRIWDTLNHARTEYKVLDYYPIDTKFRIKASFKPFKKAKEIHLKNVLGMDVHQEIEGVLEFIIDNITYSLEPLDGGPDDLFLIFADETTSGETYGGGRYLYCSRPDENSETYIDFNKSYTPPCGFTSFATCLLPWKENTIPIEIEAGEKYLFDH